MQITLQVFLLWVGWLTSLQPSTRRTDQFAQSSRIPPEPARVDQCLWSLPNRFDVSQAKTLSELLISFAECSETLVLGFPPWGSHFHSFREQTLIILQCFFIPLLPWFRARSKAIAAAKALLCEKAWDRCQRSTFHFRGECSESIFWANWVAWAYRRR